MKNYNTKPQKRKKKKEKGKKKKEKKEEELYHGCMVRLVYFIVNL